MATASAAAIGRNKKREVLPGILIGGSIAGTLDLLLAFLDSRLRNGFWAIRGSEGDCLRSAGYACILPGHGNRFFRTRAPLFRRFRMGCALRSALWHCCSCRYERGCAAAVGLSTAPLAQQYVFGAYSFTARAHVLLIRQPIAFSVRYYTARAADI